MFDIRQLSFTLLDLIQLGEIVPHYDTHTKTAVPGQHEVHDYTDKLLVSSRNLFDDKLNYLKLKLGIQDEKAFSEVRGGVYGFYKEVIARAPGAGTLVTAENIHEVKVVLINEFFKLQKGESKWTGSAFKILPPYMLPAHLDHPAAKTFFDLIKGQRKFRTGKPQLSWWLMPEIEEEYFVKTGMLSADAKTFKSSPPKNPLAKGKEE